MAKSILSAPRFHDENAARKHLEALRRPNGAECPHCGGTERNVQLQGKAHRQGLWFCGDCRQQFSVTVGTVFERSKIPLHKWLLVTHLMCASKKGMSAKQIERMLGITYKSAWFMCHRVREAMRPMGFKKVGGGGKIVEADETFWGTSKSAKPVKPGERRRGGHHKMKVFALIERGGEVRSFPVKEITSMTLRDHLMRHVEKNTRLMTDEAGMYTQVGKEFSSHETVNHSQYEYARGDVTTNSIEGYFSILKRGLIGTFHHVGEQHLFRYMNEFDFRYNQRKVTDVERADTALKGIGGKRLMYKTAN
jgi:transposase-like protein